MAVLNGKNIEPALSTQKGIFKLISRKFTREGNRLFQIGQLSFSD
jgi:hypothetical protein